MISVASVPGEPLVAFRAIPLGAQAGYPAGSPRSAGRRRPRIIRIGGAPRRACFDSSAW